MEKQFNSDLEQTRQERILTSTAGRSLSQETSLLNLVWDEPGIKSYIVDIDGELSLHHDLKPPFNKERFKRFQELFDCLVLNLMDRGMEYIDTWIEEGDETNFRFVEKFGFIDTEVLKLVKVGEQNFTFRVFRYFFPTEELMNLLEGIKD